MEKFWKALGGLISPIGSEPNPLEEKRKADALACVGDQAKVEALLEEVEQLMANDPHGNNYAPHTLITTLVDAYEQRVQKSGADNEAEQTLLRHLHEKQAEVFRHLHIPKRSGSPGGN